MQIKEIFYTISEWRLEMLCRDLRRTKDETDFLYKFHTSLKALSDNDAIGKFDHSVKVGIKGEEE